MPHESIEQHVCIDRLIVELMLFHALGLGGDGDRHRISDQAVERRRVGRLNRLPAVKSIQINVQDVRLRLRVIDADAPRHLCATSQLVIEVDRLDDHVPVLDDTIVVVRHPAAADGAVVGDHENVILGIFISHRPARRREHGRLWPSCLPIDLVGSLLDGRVATAVAQLNTEGIAENTRHGRGIDMLVVVQSFNHPEQALVILKVNPFDQLPGKRPSIAPALHRFEMGMPPERLVGVGVVVDRDQIRRPPQPAAYQCPGRQGLMMIIDDIDVPPADVLMPEQGRKGHGFIPLWKLAQMRVRQNPTLKPSAGDTNPRADSFLDFLVDRQFDALADLERDT